jgi:hypothetical protein
MGNPAGGAVVSDRELNEYERKLIANVGDHGCQIVSVLAGDDGSPSFSYSVGFWETVGQPEAIIFGLGGQMEYFALTETLRRCREGLELREGQVIDGLMEEYDVACTVRTVEQRHLTPNYLNSALWYYRYRLGRELTAAIQLVWPDEGVWPWDEGASSEFRAEQPALYDMGAVH